LLPHKKAILNHDKKNLKIVYLSRRDSEMLDL
jgi:hypothetical protein